QDESRHPERVRRRLRVLCLKLSLRTFGANQYSYHGSIWQNLAQQFQLLRFQVCARIEENACDIASRPVEAWHETDLDGIVACREHDGNRRSRRFGRERCRVSGGDNQGALTANQIGG